METLRIFISHSAADAVFMKALALDLKKINPGFMIDQLNMPPNTLDYGIHEALKNAEIVLVIVSPESYNSPYVLEEISYAREHGKKIISVIYKTTTLPESLNSLLSFDISHDYPNTVHQLSGLLKNMPVVAYSMPVPLPAPKRSIIRSVIKALNPFKRKPKYKEDEVKASTGPNMDDVIGTGSASGAVNSGYGSSKYEDAESGTTETYRGGENYEIHERPYEMSGAEMPEPPPAAAPQAPPPRSASLPSSKGKILYDIPDNMVVHKQQKCIVRIGESEAIVRDDDNFSGGEVVEDVPIARVMDVELIDINEPQRFAIKTISSAEQELEEGSYSEWLFWVTPLTEGSFSLLLKVSVIKIIDGKERRKELVFEKPVNIAAQPVATAHPSVGNQPKNLLDEKNVTELNPPSVFVSYAHKDKNYFDVFIENLAAQSGWNIWTDKSIEIGSGWYERIQQVIKDADMAVLLVSAFFISSGFIKEHEYKKFSELYKNKPGFIFLPVLLREVDINRWQSLSKLQFFSADGDDYGYPEFKGKLLPFAALCLFNAKGELNENYRRDTYFKNFVLKANTDWLKTKKMQLAN